MMRQQSYASFLSVFVLLMAFGSFVGCGKTGGGLATDSGEMTLEEFQQLKEQEQAEINQAMEKDAGSK